MKANLALADQLKDLRGQVATHEKLLFLCQNMISNFSYLLPRVVEDFNKEFERIRGEERGHCEGLSEPDESQAPEELDG